MENPPVPKKRIVIAGGSGQIGRFLAAHFQQVGHQVIVLTRAPYAANWSTVYWDGLTLPDRYHSSWMDAVDGSDVLINLSGYPIDGPLTARRWQRIRDSRILSTRILGEVVSSLEVPPRLWLNGSAAAIDSQPIDRPARGVRAHMAQLAEEWETEFFQTKTLLTRKVALRSALFLAAQPGNRFVQLTQLVRAGLGGPFGKGSQTVSWIHALDYARAIDFLIAHEGLEGPFNLASPEPLPNREFMAVLREVWDRPNGLPWPGFLLHAMSWLRADLALALHSCHAVPGHLLRAGFHFQFSSWEAACTDLARQWREAEF